MKMQLFNARAEMEFEIKDKRAEIAELKQDIATMIFNLKTFGHIQ
jgi:ribosomal protein L29